MVTRGDAKGAGNVVESMGKGLLRVIAIGVSVGTLCRIQMIVLEPEVVKK